MILILAAAAGVSAGCSKTQQLHGGIEHKAISLGEQDLEIYGIGFLTPGAATGQETDKQTLALVFSDEMVKLRPGVRVVALPEVLSALNRANLAQDYKIMYRDYLETGILERSILERIAEACNVRYLVQLNLADFTQGGNRRFGALGLRLLETKNANIRVFMQVWDAERGAVAWEGTQELTVAYETGAEAPVTFKLVAEIAASQIYSMLPGATHEPLSY